MGKPKECEVVDFNILFEVKREVSVLNLLQTTFEKESSSGD